MLRLLSLLSLALVVAACDASGPDALVPQASFDAEVRGAFSRSVQGDAVEDAYSGVGAVVDLDLNVPDDALMVLRLESDETADAFYIIGTMGDGLTPGTYPIRRAGFPEFDSSESRFVALYRYDGPDDEVGVALSTSGTLTISEVSEGEVTGSFRFSALIFDADVKNLDAEPDLEVEGEFRADVLRRTAGE